MYNKLHDCISAMLLMSVVAQRFQPPETKKWEVQRFQPLEMKKWEISPRLNAIIANVWGADQVKNREIIENVWKILPGGGSQKWEVSGQNGRVGISGGSTSSRDFNS